MPDQPELWQATPQRPLSDVPRTYRLSDPETSAKAAEDNQRRRNRQQERVLRALARCPDGANASELVSFFGGDIDKGTIARRLTDLKQLGLAEDSGRRRPTDRGSMGAVIVLTDAGREAARAKPA